jgi:predicted PurR-regulated permease PerM/methylmalonyl-CoA mutase cobalamin-binding subunit
MNKSLQRFLIFASVILVVAVLRYASQVIIPIALAVLLSFLLGPVVVRLQRWRVPRVPAVILTVVAAFTVLSLVAWVVTIQLIDLAEKLPDYERNLQAKIEWLQQPQRPAALTRMMDMIDNLRADLEEGEKQAREAEAERSGKAAEPPPVPVEVRAPPSSPVDMVQRLVGPLLGPVGTAGIAIVLLVAMLLQREDLRDRFIKVISAGRINVATQAVDDAARRVSRYLLMQLIVNATYGLPVGLGLYFIGIPNALLWGLLATVLRFIPFLGPWIAAMFPVALATAVAPGWEPLIYTILLFVVMELVSNNIIEVWLYGAGTGISNLALLIAAVFWTWVWGPIGLFLSTPMTVCLLVLGKYMPGLRFLSMLLGSEPVLEPPAQFYQRMLAMDYEGMKERALTHLERSTPAEFYDAVFIPALLLAEEDRHRGALAEVRQRFIFEAGRELIDELERRDAAEADAAEEEVGKETDSVPPLLASPELSVLVLPARDDADELVAYMLQHLLRDRGFDVEVSPINVAPHDAVGRVETEGIRLVIVSALPPAAVTSARRVCHLIRQRCRAVRVLVGIWSEQAHVSDLRARLRTARPDGVATRVGEAIALLQRLADPLAVAKTAPAIVSPATGDEAPPPPVEVPALDLSVVEPDSRFDALARDLAQGFDLPVSLVSITDIDTQFWTTHAGLPPDLVSPSSNEPAAIPAPSLNGEDLLVIPDATKDPRLSHLPFLKERGVRFYACAALRRRSGQSVGTLCIVDTKEREITPEQSALLRRRAGEFVQAAEAARVT